jgi:hypothetical protein
MSSHQNHHLLTKEDLITLAIDIGKELATLCRYGKNQKAISSISGILRCA